MSPTHAEPFAGMRLQAHAPGRRSRGRVVAWPLATLIITLGVVVGSNVAMRTDPGTGVVSGLMAGAVAAAAWLVFRVVFGSWSRKRLAILADRFDDSGDVVFAIRSTVSFDRFPPIESGLLHDYTHPWHSYQLAVLGEAGIELRQLPRKGQSVGARLRYSNVEVIADGSATFSDFADRAILVRGREKGVPYEVGIVPVRRDSLMLKPVDDSEFQRILSEFVDRVVASSDATTAGGSR